MHEIEVFILIDENGDYAVSKEESELQEAYNNDFENDGTLAMRKVVVKLKVPAPKASIVKATLPEENCAISADIG